jgi:hypothetical protein
MELDNQVLSHITYNFNDIFLNSLIKLKSNIFPFGFEQLSINNILV